MTLARAMARAGIMTPRGALSAVPVVDYPVRYGLVSRWSHDEASGNRLDSYGTNHLASNNTVGQVAGKIGNASQFDIASSRYLSVADNAGLSNGDLDFGIYGWFWADANVSNQTVGAKFETGQLEWLIQLSSTPRLIFYVSHDGTTLKTNTNTTAFAPGEWVFFGCWHDSVGDVTSSKVNNGTTVSVAHTTGVFDGTAGVTFGRGRSALPQYFGGRLDEIDFVKSPPGGIAGIADELYAYLWNNGSGRGWPWT